MPHQHFPARAIALLSVALLLSTSIPLVAPVAQAGTQFAGEDWELGSSGWTYSTDRPVAATDCTGLYAYRGLCSLEINAQVKGQVSSASRNLSLILEPPGYVVSYFFNADWPYVRSAGEFKAQLGGTSVTVNHSYAQGNHMALFTATAGTGALKTPSGQDWAYNHQTWYRVLLKADLVENKLRIEVRATDGALLATGPAVTLASGGSVGLVSFEGRYSGNSPITEAPQKINYDWLTVTAPDAPTAPQLLTAIPGPGLGQVTASWHAPADDGGVPVLRYNVYRGDTASSVTTFIGTTTNRTFVDSGMANGETHYYAARAVNAAGEGAMSNVFVGTTFNVPTAPRSLTASPGTNVGEIRLAWQPPLNNGGASITAYRVYRGSEPGAATLVAELGNVLSYTDAYRPNGTRWYYNVTATNFVGQGPTSNEASSLPRPDAATSPAALVLHPDPWWTDQPRKLNFSYTVATSQCAPAQTCPVAHEWRVYQDGSLTGADGILLASGTNMHSGHAETSAYNVATAVTPTGLDGTHRLKVAVSPREGNTQWRVTAISFQNGLPQPDPSCNADPGFSTYIMPGIAQPNQTGWQYAKTYAYKLNGTVSAHRAVFVDGCPANGPLGPGDGHFEIGYGGVLLGQSDVGALLQLIDSTGNLPGFVVGTDGDGSGVIGDSVLDCFKGPFSYAANVTCAPDASGKIVVILLPATGSAPAELPTPSDPIWGRSLPCVPVANECGLVYEYCPSCRPDPPINEEGEVIVGVGVPFQLDQTADGLGDAWQQDIDNKAREIDRILSAASDQEFPAGAPCVPTSPGTCVGKGVGDGLPTLQEFRWGTIPIGAVTLCAIECTTLLGNARDWDDDGWEDGEEQPYWNNPENDLVLNNPAWPAIKAAPRDNDADLNLDSDTPGTLFDPDSDNDGLKDGVEYKSWGTYPEFPDSDCALEQPTCSAPGPSYYSLHTGQPGTGDQIDDKNETAAWGAEWAYNFDGDGITNNTLDPDADSDGLLDGLEFDLLVGGACATLCTNPGDFDSDDDGALDGSDVRVSDGDFRVRLFISGNIAYEREPGGFRFLGEATAGTNRTNPDTDGDGLPDGWEIKYRGNPLTSDAGNDTDLDDSFNALEYAYNCPETPCPPAPVYWGGTNPLNPDSDADALLDGWEDANHNAKRDVEVDAETHALEPDTDRDGLADGHEVAIQTDPLHKDTDGDKLSDYQEVVTYARYQVDPRSANTDEWQNATQSDTLSDYDEIIRHGTNPNNWDTDNDSAADGRDSRPLTFDAPPQPATPQAVRELTITQDIYVAFRENGYADVIVQEPRGQEGSIAAVTVYINFTGMVQGALRLETSIQQAARMDDGVWGVRVGLPREMEYSTEQDFSVIVATLDGNTALYIGPKWAEQMGRVSWTDEQDAPVNGNDWLYLRSNLSHAEASTGQGAVTSGAAIPNPFDLTKDELFAVFGDFTLFRLKPSAVLAEDAGLMGNLSSVAIANPLNVTLEAPNGSFASVNLNVTVYENAFERVDPVSELGPYQMTGPGWSAYARSPRPLYTGVLIAQPDVHVCDFVQYTWCYSFFFTHKDPRAKGDMVGDTAAGLLVIGDVNHINYGVRHKDPEAVLWGFIGIAVAFAPQAKAAVGALQAEAVAIAKTDKALAKEMADREARAIAQGDRTTETILREAHIARLANAKPELVPAIKVLLSEVDEAAVRALGPALENVARLTDDIVRVHGEAAARGILKRASQASDMYPAGGASALAELADVAKVVRENAIADGKSLDVAANLMKDLDELRFAPNVNAWWHNRAKPHIIAPDNDGRWGYVFEAEQGARLHRAGLLDKMDDTLERVLVGNNPPRDVQADMYEKASGGQRIFTDSKSGEVIRSTPENRAQMEAQAAAVRQYEDARGLKREIHWIVEGRVTQPLQQWSVDIYGNYNVVVKFLDRQGNQIDDFFPE